MIRLFFPVTQVINNNRSWLFMAFSIFLSSTLIFYFTPVYAAPATDPVSNLELNQLEDLLTLIMEASPVIGIALVFMNNFLSMAQMLLLGFLAGISPLITLAINGALVGHLLSLSAHDGVSPVFIIIFGLLPHGIFELFAFFLCGAIGLKFGYHFVASPLPGKNRSMSFRYIWKEAISILPLVVALLIIAATIEILITPRLLSLFL